jgi:hypothetical protein
MKNEKRTRLVLTKLGKSNLKSIRSSIMNGEATACPKWGETLTKSCFYRTGENVCYICHKLFPSLLNRYNDSFGLSPCPCFYYSRRQIVRVIDKILSGKAEIGMEG